VSVDNSQSAAGAASFFTLGPKQAEAAFALQQEFLKTYEQSTHAWLARAQSEVTLWSDLAARLGVTRSPSEALEVWTTCASKRMQMAAEDGQHLFKDGQAITERISRAMTNGLPKAGT
jgi:hypothetical protein